MRYVSHSPEETFALGEQAGKTACPGQVYCLDGDLGTGKTVFAEGFAKGLGITEDVTSPTFTILQIYEGGTWPLYHFDVYRIGDPEELYEIGFEDYFYGNGVCLVEWASLVEELIPEDAIRVTIRKDPEQDFSYREICI